MFRQGPSLPASLVAGVSITAKVLVEGMKKAGKDILRESLQKSLSAMGRVDAGGFVVEFKPGFRHGGKYVDIAVIRLNGDLRS